jgi:hypothetical protein
VYPILERHGGFARVLATIVAGLLLMQLALAGAPRVLGAGFGVICSTQEPTNGERQPGLPHVGHHSGLCCIHHCGALDAPPPKPCASVKVPITSLATIESPPTQPAPEPRMEPKGAPQSPRAPPVAALAVSA